LHGLILCRSAADTAVNITYRTVIYTGHSIFLLFQQHTLHPSHVGSVVTIHCAWHTFLTESQTSVSNSNLKEHFPRLSCFDLNLSKQTGLPWKLSDMTGKGWTGSITPVHSFETGCTAPPPPPPARNSFPCPSPLLWLIFNVQLQPHVRHALVSRRLTTRMAQGKSTCRLLVSRSAYSHTLRTEANTFLQNVGGRITRHYNPEGRTLRDRKQFWEREKMLDTASAPCYVGGFNQHAFVLGKRRSWNISFTLRPLYVLRKVTWIGNCIDPRAGLNSVKRIISAPAENRTPIPRSYSHWTDFRKKDRKRKKGTDRTNFGCPPQRVNDAMNKNIILYWNNKTFNSRNVCHFHFVYTPMERGSKGWQRRGTEIRGENVSRLRNTKRWAGGHYWVAYMCFLRVSIALATSQEQVMYSTIIVVFRIVTCTKGLTN
jgi:hypothetical protein